MLAYHNDPSIKQQILEQLQRHYDADEIVKGQYWENGKGCAVGCTLYSDRHSEYESRFGIPVRLAYLEDVIFEGLPNDLAKDWPIRFMSSINVGADLSAVWKDFAIWLLIDPVDGVIQYTQPGTDAHRVITQVATLYQDGYTQQQMREAAVTARASALAAYAAYDAAKAASYAASYAHVAFAAHAASYAANIRAYAAANAAANAAAYAAAYDVSDTASNAADFDATTHAAYIKIANKLIELLEKQEVKNEEIIHLVARPPKTSIG